MTSRERVIRTLNHQPVDRMPIDLGSHMSTGISAFAYWNLREHLGLPTDRVWIPDCVQFLAYVDEDIRRRLHIDCIMCEPVWAEMHVWNPRGKYKFLIPKEMNPVKDSEGQWIVSRGEYSMRMPDGGFFFDGAWVNNWDTGTEDERIARYAAVAEKIYKETEYATNYVGYTQGMGFGAFFGGMDRWTKMLTDPDDVMAACEDELSNSIARAGKILKSCGKHVQLLTIGDDMGQQKGPFVRPKLVEKFTIPFIRRFCDFVHRNSDVKIFMHNCGSIKPYIPMLIDAGVDALNPVQISAENMNPRDLAREFGGKIVFWGGGCDTQDVLWRRTPVEVSAHVRELVGIWKSTRGVVFNQVHNIMGNVPPENVVAMFDTAYESGAY